MIEHAAFRTEPWALREVALDERFLAQSESLFALANGHLGLRGNLDEGEPRALSGTYLNGLWEAYDLGPRERDYGSPDAGQSIVNVTDGKILRLLVEDEPFDVRQGTLEHHERVLDLRAGLLVREARWRSEAGRAVAVRSRRLVSLADRAVAAIEYEVEPLEAPLHVALQSNLVADRPQPVRTGDPRAAHALGAPLVPRLHAGHGLRAVLAHTTRGTGLSLAAGMEHLVGAPAAPATPLQTEPDLARLSIAATLEPGRPLRVVKLLAYHWSSQRSIGWLRDQVDASLESALAQGFDGLAAAQRAYLDAFWERADVELDGDPEVQQALRFGLFHILQAAARSEGRGIPAKGLTGPGYDGHAFWDTESFVLPVLTYAMPELVAAPLRWRHATLPAARERAARLGLRGAALPWRTIGGEEASGYWPAGTAAFHVNADVAAAAARYVAATADDDFEREAGAELLAESARLWASLGRMSDDGAFRIDGVTGPDEYSALVDDNAYTNLMAQANLDAAAAAMDRHPPVAERLGVTRAEVAAWRAAARAVRIPYDERLGVHGQDRDFLERERWDFAATPPDAYPLLLSTPYFQLYRRQVVKQPDLVLALYARGDAFTAEEKRRDFEYYERITTRDSSLSAGTAAIVAAEAGHLELAHAYLGEAALMDLDDLERNAADGLHIAALAGAVLAAVAGLGGMRDAGGRLSFAPRLPRSLSRLAFRVQVRGATLVVEATQAQATYRLTAGDELEIDHFGRAVRVGRGRAVSCAIPPAPRLAPPEQPPGRAPRPRGLADDWRKTA
ncbi:MAG TPA: glycosyl hydrolase family 65 protein [Solirubrobacteraceae bacterium]|nr:glycosyl hydrolase family 65 protein [Solirubrobacteraceae bacterium]